ncbi:MAG: helicase-exonuclease AddAB subunit AddA [Clostridiales bacterium]|nr:helicase-exonuclease AddAB subunit AddA [Clostridiales bacterium]
MANNWTQEQLKAINSKGANLLVAAAAGSGKTAVLVERIVKKVLVDNIDIDKMLVVTFTNAAAAEMKERILERLYKEIEKEPNDINLQKQIILLNKANISTIHSFCLEVIKNYFYEIDITPNFRIGDTSEIELLKQEILEELFDELYEEKNEDLIQLVNVYGGYRGDEKLKEIILQIYRYIQSAPYPEKWLKEKVEMFNVNQEIDFSRTLWGGILIENIKDELLDGLNSLRTIQNELRNETELEKFFITISEDINLIENILKETTSWDTLYKAINNEFSKWPIDRKINSDLKERAKEARDKVKNKIKDIKDNILINDSKNANSDIFSMYEILKKIENIILNFSYKFQKVKREKNIVDFNDIEHFALKILVTENENGEEVPTPIAKEYQEKFMEIAIDEYQDSNLVQEKILTTISKGNNIFMVGDVKQSIYKFRQARPELFLDKYEKYKQAENKELLTTDSKIKLFKNFRSREKILNFTNLIFSDIMSKKLGEIEYNEEEYLNVGNKYETTENEIKNLNEKIELHIIDFAQTDEEEKNDAIEDKVGSEAIFVANKIKDLINQNYYVCNKNHTYRKLEFRDIVILLRSTADNAQAYEKAISNLNLPVFSDVSTSYFESIEIQTIMNLLKIIDNPNNDIPLVAILRSIIGDFTDNELVEIRLQNKKASFYEALCESLEKIDNEKLKNKIIKFFEKLEDLRKKSEYLKLDELIWYIYEKTGYYNYVGLMPNGNVKTANLKMLFEKAKDYEMASFKGLYNFINYIDRINKSNNDKTSAKLIGENENVIRIMSIHKSKGLEFPVVFLCGTGKQFNLQDLNQNILLHQDLGLGPKYINYERKIEYNTLAKEAIKIKTKEEVLAEEMRLLYVALTRSREKLIITGVDKNLEKSLYEKKKSIEAIRKEEKIPEFIIKKAKSYLDWLELASIYDEKLKEILNLNEHNKNDIVEKSEVEELKKKNKIIDDKQQQKINELLMWKYNKEFLTKIEGKTSVSKISKEHKEEIQVSRKPKILEKEKRITKAEIGTTIHLILQKLNFREEYDEEKIKALLQDLEIKKIITKEQSEVIDIKAILNFTKSSLYKEAKNAKEIHKEEAFYLNIPINELYGENSEENVLVQGIIDLYYVLENGDLVLADYKTDYVPNNDENYLIDKYKEQLLLYKTAIENSLRREVKRVYIYSTYLNKEIVAN